MKLTEAIFALDLAKSEFEDALSAAGFEDYGSIGWDEYDNSIEFYKVRDDVRLNEAIQRIVFDAGFSVAFVNHKNGWETHYNWRSGDFKISRGWRRRYVRDVAAKTTNVIAGEPDPGYFEISYWPEGWTHKEWLDTGYMRIVPDPLDVPAT
jgi:hypothetical protein